MGLTLAEKILSQRSGTEVRAGDIVIAAVDLVFVQDTTGPLTLRQFQAAGFSVLKNPSRTFLFLDHAAPSPNAAQANDHIFMRRFAAGTGPPPARSGTGSVTRSQLRIWPGPGTWSSAQIRTP